jgi:hypothetical protein
MQGADSLFFMAQLGCFMPLSLITLISFFSYSLSYTPFAFGQGVFGERWDTKAGRGSGSDGGFFIQDIRSIMGIAARLSPSQNEVENRRWWCL